MQAFTVFGFQALHRVLSMGEQFDPKKLVIWLKCPIFFHFD